ncbi:hypothetical protein BDV38DRAFT_278041 [Aspergillus pseudotamarii]|uniref:Uncharacterized protein n=1 Tax=Aspergillus pseudotamarii TaxID=132259 RepID=A0A5N6T856_ASPPS|nr:uncharacterized protein BDV38DRAFT_278041 [Aspergillus pseudotamarii]KAE8142513.1 hypothetical protein BDV38DRAFT_278041 [Aspergillus pseudotamarii]
MEHCKSARGVESQEQQSQSEKTTEHVPVWRLIQEEFKTNQEPSECIKKFLDDLRKLDPICHMRTPPQWPLKVHLFMDKIVVDLSVKDLICLFFDIPWIHPGNVNALYAIEQSKEKADKIPRNNCAHMVNPLNDVPEGNKRVCFMFEAFNYTQPSVLDNELETFFAGIKKALNDQGEEGRQKTLPIEWKRCYVFMVEKIQNIANWDKSPSNIGAIPLESSPSSSPS